MAEKVKLYSDPSFFLRKVEVPLPEGFEKGNTVGINLSPITIKSETKRGMVMKAYMALGQHILETTICRSL